VLEPLPEDQLNQLLFADETVGNNLPKSFVPAIEKGFLDACLKGPVTGHAVQGVRFRLTDGQAHAVDSSEMAFRAAGNGATRTTIMTASPIVLEPLMTVEINAPDEYQGEIIASINKRRGAINDSETKEGYVTINCLVRHPVTASCGR
jgi:elongation factor G